MPRLAIFFNDGSSEGGWNPTHASKWFNTELEQDHPSPQQLHRETQVYEPLESPLLQQDETPAATSSPFDELLEDFGDVFGIAGYDTPPELPPSESALCSHNVSGVGLDESFDDLNGEVFSDSTTVPAAASLALAPTYFEHASSNLKALGTNMAQIVSRKRTFVEQETLPVRLTQYIGLEKKRCLNAGLAFLEADFEPTILQAHETSLYTLFFGIGSPEVLVMLQELLKTRRERFTTQQSREPNVLSPADRMIAIRRGDTKIAYSGFRKRCHVHKLFVDCRPERATTTNTFVTNTIKTMATKPTSQTGNPQNLELSRISDRMFKLSYPNLTPEDPSYVAKKNYTNELRKLGQRLDLLVNKFGDGILGLIPLPSDEPRLVQALTITDGVWVVSFYWAVYLRLMKNTGSYEYPTTSLSLSSAISRTGLEASSVI